LGYAAEEAVRTGAASGGVVTALLLHLLDEGEIDGALVVKIRCENGRIDGRAVLATTREEILAARTSKYFDVPVVREGIRLIRAFPGRVAAVTLPCHATALRNLAISGPEIAARLRYVITLFCNHSCDRYLLDKVLQKNSVDQSQVVEFFFRRGRWRGQMQGKLRNGRKFCFPFSRFSYYHNFHLFSLTRCLRCHDHMGYASDFSAGDAWLEEMKHEPIKHSIIFSRHSAGTAVLQRMAAAGRLVANEIDRTTVFRSQKRAINYHYNVTARSRAAAKYGMHIHDSVGAPVRWNDDLAARLILLNHHWSHDPSRRDWISKIPQPLVMAYFLFLKLLQNF